MWSYRCYDDGKVPNLWQRWYDAHPEVQGSHDAVFHFLEQRDQWREPFSKVFDKNLKIIEVRLNGKVKYRILGFYGSAQHEFIVVATCSHKQSVYDPPDVKMTAGKRKKEIEANPGKAQLCVRPQST